MKNRATIIQIVLFFLWVLFLVLARILESYPKYDQLIFVSKHILYFLFYSLGAMLIISVFYRLLKKTAVMRNFNIKYLNLITVIVASLTLIIISNVRINYIETREIPVLAGCTYYDNYSNVIYETTLYGVCPALEIISKTDNSYHLRGELSFEGGTYHYSNGTRLLVDNKTTSVTIHEIVDIHIVYENQQIIEYEQKLTKSFIIHANIDYYEYQSYKIDVSNSYSDNSFESIQNHWYKYTSNTELPSGFEVHYDFQEEPITDMIRADVIVEDDINKTWNITGSGERLSWNSETNSIYTRQYDLSTIEFNRNEGTEIFFSFTEELPSVSERTIDIVDDKATIIISPMGDDIRSTLHYKNIDGLMLLTDNKQEFGVATNEFNYDYYRSRITNELMASSSFNGFQYYKINPVEFGTKISYYYDDISFGSEKTLKESVLMGQALHESAYSPKLDYLDYYSMVYGYVNFTNERIILESNPLLLDD